jgi:glycosyltransferase involved in cell wall biosynthesis
MRSRMFCEALSVFGEIDIVYDKFVVEDHDAAHDVPNLSNVFGMERTALSDQRSLSKLTTPWEIQRNFNQSFLDQVRCLLSRQEYDLVFARYVQQAGYAVACRSLIQCPLLVDVDDIGYQKQAKQYDVDGYSGIRERIRKKFDTRLLKRYYKKILSSADATFVCSDDDRDTLSGDLKIAAPVVVPNAIRFRRPFKYDPGDGRTLLFCGDLGFEPNIDGILWFVHEVLPRVRAAIPNVRLDVVGRHPSSDIRALESIEGVRIYANVPDVEPFYKTATVALAPIRFGGGTRLKIIESTAFSTPVVSTSLGAQGLSVESGRCAVIEDGVDGFAAGCVELIGNSALAGAMAERAYNHVKGLFCYDDVTLRLSDVIAEYLTQ